MNLEEFRAAQERRVPAVEEYAAAWRRRQVSTDAADRRRAEAALKGLYAGAERPFPRILWVPSPAAGALAYHLARAGHRPVLGAHTRGDIGTGNNRDWNALAEPFSPRPAWLRSMREHIALQLPAAVATRALSGRLFDVGARMASLLDAHVRSTAARPTGAGDPEVPAISARYGRALLGAAWDRYVDLVGRDLARTLLRRAVEKATTSLLDLRDEDSGRGWAAPSGRLSRARRAMQPGQFDAVWPAYGLLLSVLEPPAWKGRSGRRRREIIQRRLDLAASAGPWWALDGLAIISERPVAVSTDPRGRLHSETGPAIAWPDGDTIWAWHGVAVPNWVVTDPDWISVDAIQREGNVEVRRVMVERMGWERVVGEGGAQKVHQDATGILWQLHPPRTASWRERPAKVVEVVNSTPEPDGTRRHYFIRVPPELTTARQAVAWTFELGEVEYRPMIES